MEVVTVTNILKWLHLSSLIFGLGGAGVATVLAVNAARLEQGSAALWKVYDRIGSIVAGSVAVVIVSGLLLWWVKYGFAGLTAWFWVKLALIGVLIALAIAEARATGRLRSGDGAARPTVARAGLAAAVAGVTVVLAAIFAFN
jgi:protoporphyrinogen IX oxidase